MYSATVIDHFQNPRNVGDVPDADAVAEVENPACGDRTRLSIRVLDGRIAIFGHDVVREGYERVGDEQLCVSTSFALLDQDKTYVELDLATVYPNVHALREGIELKKLYG